MQAMSMPPSLAGKVIGRIDESQLVEIDRWLMVFLGLAG